MSVIDDRRISSEESGDLPSEKRDNIKSDEMTLSAIMTVLTLLMTLR